MYVVQRNMENEISALSYFHPKLEIEHSFTLAGI
jgi:hypothetical protein